MDITLFEFDVDDATFTAHAPFSGSRAEDEEAESADTGDESGGRGRVLAVLVALALLAALVWVSKRGAPGDVSIADAEEAVVPE